jgi:hypothetical protein
MRARKTFSMHVVSGDFDDGWVAGTEVKAIFASSQCFHFDGAIASIRSRGAALVLNLLALFVVEVNAVAQDSSSALRSGPRDVDDTGLVGNSAGRCGRDGTNGHWRDGGWALAAFVLNVDHYFMQFFSVKVVEHVAEIASRALDLYVVRDGDFTLAFIMVEIERVL